MPYQADWQEESVTREELDALSGVTLLEFGAEWCPHCIAVQELLREKLSQSDLRHLKIADGRGKPLGRSFRVKLWPNFVLMKDGEVRVQLARPGTEELTTLLDQALSQ